MTVVVVSSFSDRDEREIDEYHNQSISSSSSSDSSSSGSDSTDEQYPFGVLGAPLEVLQEEMRKMATFRSSAALSINVQPSTLSLDEEEDTLYCCAMDIPSKIDEKRLYMLRGKYQIPEEVNPHLATSVE